MNRLSGSREELLEELGANSSGKVPAEGDLLQIALLELLTLRETLALRMEALASYPKLTKRLKGAHKAVEKQCQSLASELMSIYGPKLAAAIVNSKLEAAKNTAVTAARLQLEAETQDASKETSYEHTIGEREG